VSYSSSSINIGKIGEKEAIKFLKKNHFEILSQHFTCRWGEIDIVAKKDEKIYFIEVKTRTSKAYGEPHAAITFWKLRSLKRAISYYLLKNKFSKSKLALAVISIFLDKITLELKSIDFYSDVHLLYNF